MIASTSTVLGNDQQPNAEKYPCRSMEARIQEANKALKKFLTGGCSQARRSYFQKSIGLCLLSTVEVAGIVSGSIGHGVMFRKLESGSWSAPSACDTKSFGAGIMVGVTKKDIVVLIFEEEALKAMCSQGFKMGAKCENTIGSIGGSKHWGHSTLAIGCNNGVFTGSSLECTMLSPSNKVNQAFYGKKLLATEILFNNVQVPESCMIADLNEVYMQLEQASKP